jgi:hypothetical protein
VLAIVKHYPMDGVELVAIYERLVDDTERKLKVS